MDNISTNKLVIAVIANLILGVICGLYLPGVMLALSFVGQIYVKILQIIFIPLVAAAIITAVSSYTDGRQRGRAVLATLSFFAATSIIAIIIGLVTVSIFQPGAGVSTGAAFIPEEIASVAITSTLGIRVLTMGGVLGWIIALIVVASVLGGLGRNAAPVTKFFETIHMIVQKLLHYLIMATPFAIFFIVGAVVARNSGYLPELGGSLLKLSLTLMTAFLVHALIVIPLLLKFFGGRSPIDYFKNIFPALTTAFATASPTAALAVTYENSLDRNKLDSRSAALVLPLGTSLNVDGRAMYVVICAIFVAQAYSIELSFVSIIYLAAVVFLFSLGTATVPFAGMITLAIVFDTFGFPSSAYGGIGIIFAIDWFWGRNFAALDVWSDTVVAATVEEVTSTAIFQKKPQRASRAESERARRPLGDSRPDPGRDDRKRDDFRRDSRIPERTRKPFVKSDLKIAGRDRPRRPAAASPFELKPERSKSFDPETAKARDRAPFEIAHKDEVSSSESARKMREKISYGPKDKKDKKEVTPGKKAPLKAEVSDSDEIISAPTSAVTAPPLIRELTPAVKEALPEEIVAINETPQAKETPPEKIEAIDETPPVKKTRTRKTAAVKKTRTRKTTAVKKTKAAKIAESQPEAASEPVSVPVVEVELKAPDDSKAVAEPKVEKSEVKEPVEAELEKPDLFGRTSHLKGPRRKSGSATPPSTDEPEFSTENQQFGRKSRKKSSK
ncbi:MAG: cation:dicarboxylase symporter family transporter [candidate division Zixibacteria bacterium]|nr:cation:dicarboxylase symporter family transporter [candidate division Zixibacteria bacterium]